MYKLLIVEDEHAFREGILTMIDWESEGICILGTAANGRQALALMEQEQPDILLTDIRMPQMTGLELVEEANKRGWEFIPVLLTGHSEFEYAQQAIKLGVFDYILKPCNPKQVREAIGRAKNKLIQTRVRHQQADKLEQKWNANVSMIKQERLLKWLRAPKPLPLPNYLKDIEDYGIKLVDKPVLAIVFRFDKKALNALSYTEDDLPLIRFAAANIMEESIGDRFAAHHELLTLDDQFVLIANVPDGMPHSEIVSSLEPIQSNLSVFLKVSVSIGVGGEQSLSDVHLSYREAEEALSRRFFHGSEGLFMTGETNVAEVADSLNPKFQEDFADLEQRIRESLAASNYSNFINEVEKWLQAFKERDLSIQRIRLHSYSFIDSLIREIQVLDGEASKEAAEQLEQYAEQIGAQETFEELSTLLTVVIQKFVEFRHTNMKKQPHKTIQYVLDLIEQKYMTNLTLKSISEDVFISQSHLSTLFRQEMGINFLDYLHQYRIEKAKQLLMQDNGKVYTVAREVGYYDEAHFVRFFKKWAGMLPSQFKKQYGS
ncbi:response regulator [Paenibacillus sp. NPDC058071]|uniref:response regulator transcription factor n=1 Tax=Paenibacillus sp. NPDC058071 TaxID=3346326 RepID=UPI0036D7ED83